MSDKILCYGEVLWDALPAGLFVGGAPFNAAAHLHQLGEDVVFASRIGDDLLGEEILRRLEHWGMATNLVQRDTELPTGFVRVALEVTTGPAYTILEPSAWDRVEASSELIAAASDAQALVFGSLAQRSECSRNTLRSIAELGSQMVFDVNLRPPFDDRDIVEESLGVSSVVKLNDDEADTLAGWYGLPSDGLPSTIEALADRFEVTTVCVTRGESGAILLHNGEWAEHPGYRVEVADTVGAGDAFLAALLSRLFAGDSLDVVLDYANAVGAFVASRNGATPVHDANEIASIPCR
jgi:fructokinase